MKDYNQIDQEDYDNRHLKTPREAYLRNFYYPRIKGYIEKYASKNTVLDLGCGTGIYTALAGQSKRVIGFDISISMLKFAKKKHENVDFCLVNAEHLPVKDRSVDSIISIGLMEFINRPVYFKEVNRILSEDGVIIIQCFNKYAMARYPVRLAYRILGIEWSYNEPSYKEMLKLFSINGFELVDTQLMDGFVYIPIFLDVRIGKYLYPLVESLVNLLGWNPFSNGMLFVARKKE